MTTLILAAVLLQVVVPLCLISWQTFGRPRSRAAWMWKVVGTSAYLIAITRGGLWLAIPWYAPRIFAGLFAVAVLYSLRASAWYAMQPMQRNQRLRVAALAGVSLLVMSVAVWVHLGRAAPNSESVNLLFPLGPGSYRAVGAGGNRVLNPHFMTLTDARYGRFHGQSHAVDLVADGRWGTRLSGLAPRSLARYAIYGAGVAAPCAGTVIQAVDVFYDQQPPENDRAHMAGNHVIIACGRYWIVLAHVQRNSVRVRIGDVVAAGDSIARVGNSGNTDEPHLHIHAQLPGTASEPFDAEPVPIRFGGRYLARNDRVSAK